MKIIIETIPHKKQRYPTVGDYWIDADGTMQVRISQELGSFREQSLVLMHELAELFVCMQDGVDLAAIDSFDMLFERDREKGLHSPQDEPGDDVAAPYYKQHQIATGIERILAGAMNVDWNKYAATIESL